MNSFDEIFSLMTEKLDLSDVAYNLWISPIKPVSLENGVALLYVAAPFTKKVVEENYVHRFKSIFKDILGFEVEIQIMTEEDISPGIDGKFEPIPELDDDIVMRNELETSIAIAEYKHTFDTFIVGASNKLAYKACQSIANNQTGIYNPLFIYGPSGLGKTHLLTAIYHHVSQASPNIHIMNVSAEAFTNEYIEAISDQVLEKFRSKYRQADILLVDDIHFIAGKDSTEQEFFYTFNELHRQNKQIVLTSDRSPKDIKSITERLRTRFEWGLTADINPPDFETRVAIVRRKAELLRINIPEEVTEFIASKLKLNIRQIEGAVTKMKALILFSEIQPTISMAQNVIRDILNDHQPTPVTVERIIKEISHIYNVSPDEIRSQKRSAQISTARQVSIFVVQEITDLSYTAIGQEFGGRDHSTVVYAINKVRSIMQKDNSFKERVEDIIKNIRDSQN